MRNHTEILDFTNKQLSKMSKFLSFEDILLHFKNLATYIMLAFRGKP